jgi:biotin carboxyl carrier protein
MSERFTLRHGDCDYEIEVLEGGSVRVDGGEIVRPPRMAVAIASGTSRWVFLDGEVFEFRVEHDARRRAGGHHGLLSAPMPATVIQVNVNPGDRVRRGDTLIVLEAMKMELPVRAESDGVVTAVHCGTGELVQPGVTLVDLEG